MGLDITFYKTKNENLPTNIEYSCDELDDICDGVADFRNTFVMRILLEEFGLKNDHIIYITAEIIKKLDSDCFYSYWTVENVDDMITKLKRAMVNNSLIAHMSY